MCLDGLVTHDEPFGDLAVRQAFGDQAQDLRLARRELGQRARAAGQRRPEPGELADETARHRRREQRIAGGDDPHGLEERLGGHVLEQEEVARRRTGGFSLGMAQRLGIAAAMLGDPPVLLFDEPVNGLDPDGIRWIRVLLRSLADEGRALLVSSHLMGELEGIADDLVVIGRGRLIAQKTVTELLSSRSNGGRVHVRTPQVVQVMTVLAAAGGTVSSTSSETLAVSGLDPERIAELIAEHRLQLHELYRERASLEDAFIELTRDAVEYAADARPEPRS